MATNGSRNAAATSQALNVGAQMPTSGDNASPTPAAVPPSPLTSAYVCIALMNDTPTSGPIAASITHQARDTTSSRHSFATSHPNADLREGKKDLFEVRGRRVALQLRQRAFAAHAAAAQEHESIADAFGVADLMD